MTAESIRVYFQPLLSVGGNTFYHETLIYNNSDGRQFYATAYAPKRPPGEDPGASSAKATVASDVGTASSAAATSGASPYGTIVTQWGRVDDLPDKDRSHLLGSPDRPYDSQVLKVGDDLSENWSKTVQAYYQIGERPTLFATDPELKFGRIYWPHCRGCAASDRNRIPRRTPGACLGCHLANVDDTGQANTRVSTRRGVCP